MSISTYKVTKKSAHIQVFSFDMCRLNYGLSLYRDFFSALVRRGSHLLCSSVAIAFTHLFIGSPAPPLSRHQGGKLTSGRSASSRSSGEASENLPSIRVAGQTL